MLLTLASAKGAPGVTTLGRVLAAVWPAPSVLVDADPAGGDLASVATDERGEPLDPDRGLISLAVEARRGALQGLPPHVQRIVGGQDVICGLQTPEQLVGLGPAWPTIAAVLARSPEPVIADAGRLVPGSPSIPIVQASDVLLLVTRPGVAGYAHLVTRLRWLVGLSSTMDRGPTIGVVVVAPPRERHAQRDLAALLQHSGLRMPVVGAVAYDEDAARVIDGTVSRGIAGSLLVRSARALVAPTMSLATAGVPGPFGVGGGRR